MSTQSYFVAGTDTGVGKTRVTAALMSLFKQHYQSVIGLKPVAAGTEIIDGLLKNDDAHCLQQLASPSISYERVNPVCLDLAMAPHIAAQKQGVEISLNTLLNAYQKEHSLAPDIILVEGAGGWRVPLNKTESIADYAKQLNMPVILVVGLRLGCLNHAALSLEAIKADGLSIAGWVANRIDPGFEAEAENITMLKHIFTGIPCLGHVPFIAGSDCPDIKMYLSIKVLVDS